MQVGTVRRTIPCDVVQSRPHGVASSVGSLTIQKLSWTRARRAGPTRKCRSECERGDCQTGRAGSHFFFFLGCTIPLGRLRSGFFSCLGNAADSTGTGLSVLALQSSPLAVPG